MSVTDRVLRLAVMYDAQMRVNRSEGTILGAKIIEAGPLNDFRQYVVDTETLEQVAALGNAPNRGTKARWTHSDETLGTHLGYWSNFRVDDDSVRADLKFAASASKSPMGDLREYMIELALEAPESFGVSICCMLDQDLMSEPDSDGNIPLRISSLYSCDVVGEPAATRGGLFDVQDKEVVVDDQRPEECSEMIEEKPEVSHKDFIEKFGDRGARWFLEGKSYQSCLELSIEEFEVKVEDLVAQLQAAGELIAELQQNIADYAGMISEEEPVDAPVEASEEDKAAAVEEEKKKEEMSAARKFGLTGRDVRWSRAFKVS